MVKKCAVAQCKPLPHQEFAIEKIYNKKRNAHRCASGTGIFSAHQ